MRTNTDIARRGETLAAEYLERAGLQILERNFRFHHGEIDIIARDGAYTVFVEVKTRLTTTYGLPIEAVPPQKQRQLVHVARGWMYMRGLGELTCRFDVIGITLTRGGPDIMHIRNAFSTDF